jgi:hypothetical protein
LPASTKIAKPKKMQKMKTLLRKLVSKRREKKRERRNAGERGLEPDQLPIHPSTALTPS